jgi:pimeloyl-[acyl-carrier protein] methyl ester esterase
VTAPGATGGSPRGPLLVVLPGLDGTGRRLGEFVNRLAPIETRVVRYPDQPLGYEELAALVSSSLPSDRPFVLLGESFSGPLVIRIAARRPEGLDGIILCGTFAKNPYPWLGWARPLARHLPLKSLPRRLRAVLMWGTVSTERVPPQSERAMAGVSSAVIRCRISALLSVDESAALCRIHVPALVLEPLRDRVIPRAATRHLSAALPGAQRVEIDGPHLLLQARPVECAAAVSRFMHCRGTRV